MADGGFKRKLTAILSADVEGYSRLMPDNEEATVRTLTSYLEVLSTLIQQYIGFGQFYLRRPAIELASVEKMAYPLPDKSCFAVFAKSVLRRDRVAPMDVARIK